MVSVNYQTYKNLVKQNWLNGNINESKAAMLTNLRKTLRISDEEHQQIIDELRAASGLPPLSGASTGPPSPVPVQPAPIPAPIPTPIQSPAPAQATTITPVQAPVRDGPPAAPAPIMSTGIQRVSPAPKVAEQPTSSLLEAAKGKRDEDLNFDECLELGKEAYRTGDYKRSVDLCDRALKIKPNNSQALFFKKRARSKMDEAAPASAAPVAQAQTASASDPMLSHMGAPKAATPATASGSIIPKCLSCRDTKVCSWCKGKGLCWMCQGTGICNTCKGSGTVNDAPCPKCKGSSKCDSCIGTGKCYWCKGTAKCHKCSKD